jgi:hypothetical protein
MPRQMGRWLAVLALRREARLRIAAAPLELRYDPSRAGARWAPAFFMIISR